AHELRGDRQVDQPGRLVGLRERSLPDRPLPDERHAPRRWLLLPRLRGPDPDRDRDRDPDPDPETLHSSARTDSGEVRSEVMKRPRPLTSMRVTGPKRGQCTSRAGAPLP